MLPSELKYLTDPTFLTSFLRELPSRRRFQWRNYAQIEEIMGSTYKRQNWIRTPVRGAMIDAAARLPKGILGYLQETEGGMIKIGRTFDATADILLRWTQEEGGLVGKVQDMFANEVLDALEGAVEWPFMRAMFGETVTLDGGATQLLGTIGGSTSTTVDWSDKVNATGVQDLIDANESLKALPVNDGEGASEIIMSLLSFQELKAQEATQERVYGPNQVGRDLSDGQVRSLLTTELGLPPISIYEGKIRTMGTDGTASALTRVIGQNLTLLLPSIDLFPNGMTRLIKGRTPDQIMYQLKGLVPESVSGGWFGASEETENPAMIEWRGEGLIGIDPQAIAHSWKLDN